MLKDNTGSLALSRTVLRLLIKLNILMGLFILALLVATLAAQDFAMRALTKQHPDANNAEFLMGVRVIMMIGIAAAPVAHLVLTRLLAIVDTVRDGDPFIILNAARLQTIAWAILVLEMMHLVVGAVAAAVSSEHHPLDIDWNFSVTRWLAVVLLFVLARVFEQGARMRDDLEGTI